jgi:hypothetical protein
VGCARGNSSGVAFYSVLLALVLVDLH